MVKNPLVNVGEIRDDTVLIPGSGRSPGEGNGNGLQYFCLWNPMGKGACQDSVHGVANSQTWLGVNTQGHR